MRIHELHGNFILASQCVTMKKYLKKKEIEVYDKTNPTHVALAKIWELAHDFNFRKLRQISGLTRESFVREYRIPRRTIEHWDVGERTPPSYVLELLAADVLSAKIKDEIE